jgi:hypothetical protein
LAGDDNKPSWLFNLGYADDSFRLFRAPANGVGGNQTFVNVVRVDNAANMSIGNGASAVGFKAYNTVDNITSPTNYERGVFDWTTTSNVLTIGTQAGGTGSGRTMILAPAQLYSAAGVALPTCAAATKGFQTVVSDATAPTYNANYASGGAVVAHVVCNGTNWVTQ